VLSLSKHLCEASARSIEPPRTSEVSFDATLREEGSFSDFGDRKFGQVIPWKR
jgi:hypothetical protein